MSAKSRKRKRQRIRNIKGWHSSYRDTSLQFETAPHCYKCGQQYCICKEQNKARFEKAKK